MAPVTSSLRRAIILTGPVGVGKTTITYALAELLTDRDLPNAAIDMDALRRFYPAPPGDRFGAKVGLRNLTFVVESYASIGIETITIADVVESADDLTLHRNAMPQYDVRVVLLKAPTDLIHQRLQGRESAGRLAWYVQRSVELEVIFDREDIGDLTVDVGSRPPQEVALEIAERFGLLDRTSPDPEVSDGACGER